MKLTKSQRKEVKEELHAFIKAVGDVPISVLCDVPEDLQSEFDDLENDCQEFVSNASDKMREIAKKARISLKGTWL